MYKFKILVVMLQWWAVAAPAVFGQEQITLLFAGDVMNNKPQLNAAYHPKTDTYDYHSTFKYIKPVIEQADVAIANLELTLPGKPPYTGFPLFRTPDVMADALKYAGFDALVTANNHANDSGPEGVLHTIDVVRNLGFWQTGTFKDSSDRALNCPLLIEKNGFTIALLNYTFHTNGIATKPPVIVSRIDPKQIAADVAAARNLAADIVIAFFHWGEEYKNNENAYQREWAQTAANLGVDLVIGAHPHVVQPVKMLTAKRPDGTQKQVPVAYSLGNFISNAISTNTSVGLMLETILTRDTLSCETTITHLNFMPVWRYLETKAENKRVKNTYYALPASAFGADTLNLLQMPPAPFRQLTDALALARNVLKGGLASEKAITLQEVYGSNLETAVCKVLEDRQQNQGMTAALVSAKTTNTKTATPGKLAAISSSNTEPAALAVSASGKTYKVQFQASRNGTLNNHPFTNVSIEKNEQGWYRYLSGTYTTSAAAQKQLQKVKQQGYDQAFIAIYQNGKRKN